MLQQGDFQSSSNSSAFLCCIESSYSCPKSCLGARYTTDLQFAWRSLPPVGLMSFLHSLQGRVEEPAELGRSSEPPLGGKPASWEERWTPGTGTTGKCPHADALPKARWSWSRARRGAGALRLVGSAVALTKKPSFDPNWWLDQQGQCLSG